MCFDPLMVNPRHLVRLVVLACALLAASASAVHAQSFTLTPSAFKPFAVDPGSSATAQIALAATGGFNSSVSLTCAVTTSNSSAVNIPTCLISPDVATPFATLSLTVSTCGGAVAGTSCAGETSPGLYTITVTGVSGSITVTATLTLSVEDIVEDYTLSVLPTTATPSPVTAGQVATTTVTITPIGSYSGSVTLACLSITPIVAAAPFCSFQYPPNQPLPNSVAVGNGVPGNATLLITTYGPQPSKTSVRMRRLVYALWLAVPGLMLAGASGVKGRKRRLLSLFLLTAIACGVLLVPACGTNNTNNPTGQNTPKGTYTFTLTGIDSTGVGPSNATSSQATVMLTVNN